MKASKKLLSAFLTLVMLLALTTTPVFAADAPHDVDTRTVSATWKTWGDPLLNDSSLTINGVIGQEPYEDTVIFDVIAGGGYTLNMSYPAGRERFYNTYMDNAIVNRSEQIEEPKDEWSQDRSFENSRAQKQFVYTCPESMVSTSGHELLFHYWLDWTDSTPGSEYSENDGNISFWLRVHPASATPAQPTSTVFGDVAATSPYADGIAWAVEQGITKGITATTFGPGNTCTTSHILTFLYRAAGSPNKGSNERAAVTAWANGLGIDTSDLSAPCTRAAAVNYMWKAAGSPTTSNAPAFSDVPAAADYAQAVAWAVGKGITNGTSATTFAPGNTCTRGQIVTFLYRADSK